MIVSGPTISRYAELFDIPIAEVVAWMNQYITGPWPSSMVPDLEATESGREASIKAYVKREVEFADLSSMGVGVNERIKAANACRREASNA